MDVVNPISFFVFREEWKDNRLSTESKANYCNSMLECSQRRFSFIKKKTVSNCSSKVQAKANRWRMSPNYANAISSLARSEPNWASLVQRSIFQCGKSIRWLNQDLLQWLKTNFMENEKNWKLFNRQRTYRNEKIRLNGKTMKKLNGRKWTFIWARRNQLKTLYNFDFGLCFY